MTSRGRTSSRRSRGRRDTTATSVPEALRIPTARGMCEPAGSRSTAGHASCSPPRRRFRHGSFAQTRPLPHRGRGPRARLRPGGQSPRARWRQSPAPQPGRRGSRQPRHLEPRHAQPGQHDAGAQAGTDRLRDRGGTGRARYAGPGVGRRRSRIPRRHRPPPLPLRPRWRSQSPRATWPARRPPGRRRGRRHLQGRREPPLLSQHLPRLHDLRRQRPQEPAAGRRGCRCSATRSRCSSRATPSTPCCGTPST